MNMKPSKYFLSKLPEPYKTKALRALKSFPISDRLFSENLTEAIKSFDWERTGELKDWEYLHSKLVAGMEHQILSTAVKQRTGMTLDHFNELIELIKEDYILIPRDGYIGQNSPSHMVINYADVIGEKVVEFLSINHGVDPNVIRGKVRKREFTDIRKISCLFIQQIFGHEITLAEIGRVTGFGTKEKPYNHATVLYNIDVINNLMDTDKRKKVRFHDLMQKFIIENRELIAKINPKLITKYLTNDK